MMGTETQGAGKESQDKKDSVVLIGVEEARREMQSLTPPLLVLAYDDEHKFRTFGLEGSIPYSVLASRFATLPLDKEIILYCA